jgi:hypothetical protein
VYTPNPFEETLKQIDGRGDGMAVLFKLAMEHINQAMAEGHMELAMSLTENSYSRLEVQQMMDFLRTKTSNVITHILRVTLQNFVGVSMRANYNWIADNTQAFFMLNGPKYKGVEEHAPNVPVDNYNNHCTWSDGGTVAPATMAGQFQPSNATVVAPGAQTQKRRQNRASQTRQQQQRQQPPQQQQQQHPSASSLGDANQQPVSETWGMDGATVTDAYNDAMDEL